MITLVDHGATLVSGLVGEVVRTGNVCLDLEVDDTVVARNLLESESLISATVSMLATVLTVIQMNHSLGLPPVIIINNCLGVF